MSRFRVFLTTAAAVLATAATTWLIAVYFRPAPNPAPVDDGGQKAPLTSGKASVPTLPSESRPRQPSVGGIPVGKPDIPATDLIEKITVKIEVGAGADLEEPIALDLGLGYPLWLYPVGRKAENLPPRGAIPQQSTAKAKIAAGDSATFTFSTKGEPGQDKFRTSPQLLANTRLGDVARVGFASKGTTKWVLAGYEVAINDKPFAAGKPNVQAGDRTAHTKRLAELAAEIAPLNLVRNDKLQLLRANQLEEKDKTELLEVLAKLRPLVREKTWLKGQLKGKYLWYEDPEYKSPNAGKPTVRSAKVTLVTFPHTGADTENYVYVRIGGHKYFISSPARPLTYRRGPQIFHLDLLAGPLTDADLRDWAVGMLANAKPYDDAPDRWHAKRIAIEIDGEVLYDSDKNPRDRLSLSAVRLIPPAHLDREGNLELNKDADLQIKLWEPAKGAGLDPETGMAIAPPPPDDPRTPKAEPIRPGSEATKKPPEDAPPPDVPPVDPPADAPPAAKPPDEPPPPGTPPADAPPTLLPGEQKVTPPPDDGGDGTGTQPPDDGGDGTGTQPPVDGDGTGTQPPDDGGDGTGTQPPDNGGGLNIDDTPPVPSPGGDNSAIEQLLKDILDKLNANPPPPPPPPKPSGPAPAIEFVHWISGRLVNDTFTVQWKVTGDPALVSEVTQYLVTVMVVEPDNPTSLASFTLGPDGIATPGTAAVMTFSGVPNGLDAPGLKPRYLVAVVTGMMKDGSSFIGFSSARMVFPVGTEFKMQPQIGDEHNPHNRRGPSGLFRYHLPKLAADPAFIATKASADFPINFLPDDPKKSRVWELPGFTSHLTGVNPFEKPVNGGLHLGVRPHSKPGDVSRLGDTLRVHLWCLKPTVPSNLVADLGFQGVGAVGSFTAKITQLRWFKDTGPLAPKHTLLGVASTPTPISVTAVANDPMGVAAPSPSPLIVAVDPTDAKALTADYLVITIEFICTGIEVTDISPVLFGVRLIPQ